MKHDKVSLLLTKFRSPGSSTPLTAHVHVHSYIFKPIEAIKFMVSRVIYF
ncbi:Protein of unknown function [Pyronema omphalodes CBS 100304]|uniref:Uncharacterized protein n=1 Tax=Pyronema omphalodes (strain CBS 100304) TaxID=1076935 RepID=U4LCI3_PYROM|nr:Protein of unknown function [Pyronema omphalodes CBS 100304]